MGAGGQVLSPPVTSLLIMLAKAHLNSFDEFNEFGRSRRKKKEGGSRSVCSLLVALRALWRVSEMQAVCGAGRGLEAHRESTCKMNIVWRGTAPRLATHTHTHTLGGSVRFLGVFFAPQNFLSVCFYQSIFFILSSLLFCFLSRDGQGR